MKERPILFNGEMVRATLEGRKTQTRRVVKPQPSDYSSAKMATECISHACPFGQPGDRLWVRETWWYSDSGIHLAACADSDEACYQSVRDSSDWCWESELEPGDTEWEYKPAKKKPSIHMPRWACRTTLEIVSVRVERVQDIGCLDAQAEGFEGCAVCTDGKGTCHVGGLHPFTKHWNSTAKPGEKFNDNPWCWVIEYKQIEREASE